MIRRPPRSTRTDTLFPYTTLFRSGRTSDRPTMVAQPFGCNPAEGGSAQGGAGPLYARTGVLQNGFRSRIADAEGRLDAKGRAMHHRHAFAVHQIPAQPPVAVDLRCVRRGYAHLAGTGG